MCPLRRHAGTTHNERALCHKSTNRGTKSYSCAMLFHMPNILYGLTEHPGVPRMRYQVALIRLKILCTVSSYSDLASDDEIRLAVYTLLTTDIYRASASNRYAWSEWMHSHALGLANDDRSPLVGCAMIIGSCEGQM